MALWQTVTLGWVLGLTNGGDGGGRAISNVSTLATTGNVTVGGAISSAGSITVTGSGNMVDTPTLKVGNINASDSTGSLNQVLRRGGTQLIWQSLSLGWILGLTGGGDAGGNAISNVSTLATTGNVTVGGTISSTGSITVTGSGNKVDTPTLKVGNIEANGSTGTDN